MNVKKLIDLINIFEANVIFDNPKDSIEEVKGGRSPLSFTPIERERKR